MVTTGRTGLAFTLSTGSGITMICSPESGLDSNSVIAVSKPVNPTTDNGDVNILKINKLLFMVQWFNREAVLAFLKSGNPVVLSPKLWVPSIQHLNYVELRRDFEAIVFDKDNCLTPPYQHRLLYADAVERCKAAFGNNVAVLSNCVGCEEHYKGATEEFEGISGLRVIRHSIKKPDCIDSVYKHFGDKINPNKIVMVGDRLTTDILMANRHGMYGVLVDPYSKEGDNWAAIVIRRLEHRFLRSFKLLEKNVNHKYTLHPYFKLDYILYTWFINRHRHPKIPSLVYIMINQV